MIRGGRVTLAVGDVARSVRFYIETLGMKLVEEAKEAAVIDAGEGFLIELAQGAPKTSARIAFFPKVPIAEAIAIYENRGVTFHIEQQGGSTVASFEDIDANALALVAPAQ